MFYSSVSVVSMGYLNWFLFAQPLSLLLHITWLLNLYVGTIIISAFFGLLNVRILKGETPCWVFYVVRITQSPGT